MKDTRRYRVNCEQCERITAATRNPETFAASCDECGREVTFISSARNCPHDPVHAWSERGECTAQVARQHASKSKRKREVFPTDEIPHLWAHKVQDSAGNPGGNLYFNADTIYSYGSHFPIARHISHGKQSAILFTRATYSVTTSRHLSMVRQSIPNSIPVFNVPDVVARWGAEVDHKKNVARYIAEIDSHLLKSARARSSYAKESNHETATHLHDEALAYARFFKLPRPKLPAIPALDSDGMKQIKAREAKRLAAVAEQTKRERAERLACEAERIERWRNGEDVGGFYGDIPTMLRIEGAEVVTSRGARFPVSHARRGLALVRSVIARGEEWHSNGHTCHLGHYSLDRIEANGTVHAGCHVVTYAEIERIAPQLDACAFACAVGE